MRSDPVAATAVAEKLPVAVFRLDAVGTVVGLNSAAEQLLGRPAKEIVGSRLAAAIGMDVSEWTEPAGTGSTTRRCTAELRRRDGTVVICDLFTASASGEQEQSAVTLVVALDVTERVTEAEAIRKHNRLLLEVQTVAGLGSWKWDIALDTLQWSSEHYRIFGVEPSTFTPTYHRVLDLFHEDCRSRVEATVWAAIDSHGPFSYCARIRRPDGEMRWIESAAAPSLVDGVVVAMVGTVRDVTPRESGFSSLRESEARYKMMIETANEAIWLVDSNGDTTFANERLAELLGRPVEELLGASVFAFLDDEGQSAAAESFEVLRQGRPNRLDLRFIRADGSELWALISASPVLDANGQYTGALAMLTDITERHRTETELRRSQAGLAEAQRLAHLGSWAVNRATGGVICSDEMFRVLGSEPGQGVPSLERFIQFVHPDDRSRGEAFLRRVNGDSEAFDDELRVVTADGDQRWLFMRAQPVVDDAGRVTEMHGTVQDITERKAAEEQLTYLTLHDRLTGLPNRTLFNNRLQHALTGRDGSVTVMLVDLDGFKAINDSLGHTAGDALLVAVANRISNGLRLGDTVARFGGDEFTILIQNAAPEEVGPMADRLLRTIAIPIELGGRNVLAQASIGIATGRRGQVADELVRDADAAMYVAKRKGGQRCETFSSSMHSAVVERLALECDLRSVELGSEMFLQYQPIVDLGDGHLAGVEALLRWNHPRLGSIAPLDFIPIAEEIGAIVPIGRWVVEEACRQASRWREHHPETHALSMSVNVSARQLTDSGIVADVARALEQSRLDPSLLTLEITETMIVADEDEVCARLNELKELGVRISVDDFGTGYSSLGHLEHFPVDELKIDRTFVASLGGDSPESGVALATIRLARTLHLDIVAEGIEREDQLIELRRAACTRGQGYYFWKPMAAESVDILLEEGAHSILPAVPRVILVVEDDEALLETTARLLRHAGMEAVEARSGQEALQLAAVTRLDAVILDVALPDIDGFEVCRQLNLRHGDVPVIYISGAAVEVDDRVRGLNQGAEAYLTKPVAPLELLAVLGSMLRRNRSNLGR
jgi:diguanylate cyclase (GGDEF)-like protein/PAS domain S-box-containing protein